MVINVGDYQPHLLVRSYLNGILRWRSKAISPKHHIKVAAKDRLIRYVLLAIVEVFSGGTG